MRCKCPRTEKSLKEYFGTHQYETNFWYDTPEFKHVFECGCSVIHYYDDTPGWHDDTWYVDHTNCLSQNKNRKMIEIY